MTIEEKKKLVEKELIKNMVYSDLLPAGWPGILCSLAAG